jgi:hypothetical protein
MTINATTPAALAFNRSAIELTAALAEAKRRYLEWQRDIDALKERPLMNRPEARGER